MGFLEKMIMFRAATLSKRSFTEEAVKCLLQELINAGHSIRICLTVTTVVASFGTVDLLNMHKKKHGGARGECDWMWECI